MNTRAARAYRGALIHPMGVNLWGGRWEVTLGAPDGVGAQLFCADTLAGIKELVRDKLAEGWRVD